MRCLPRSNENLTTGPVSHWVTGRRWNIANNYLALIFEVYCTSKLNSPGGNIRDMETNKKTIYEAPSLQAVEMAQEGVICQSAVLDDYTTQDVQDWT